MYKNIEIKNEIISRYNTPEVIHFAVSLSLPGVEGGMNYFAIQC